MRGWVSVGHALFWSATGAGMLSLVLLSGGQAKHGRTHSDAATSLGQFRGKNSGAAAPDNSESGGGGRSYVARVPAGAAEGCGEDCNVGKLGRKWAALQRYDDPAECDDTSSSIDFQSGCRAFIKELRAHPETQVALQ